MGDKNIEITQEPVGWRVVLHDGHRPIYPEWSHARSYAWWCALGFKGRIIIRGIDGQIIKTVDYDRTEDGQNLLYGTRADHLQQPCIPQ